MKRSSDACLNQLDRDCEKLIKTREGDLAAFILGRMENGTRQAFVEELRQNQALRIAVGVYRQRCEAEVTVSEGAFQLLEDAVDGIRQANPLFPGDRYIAGLENRPDIGPQREKWYERSIEAAEKLVALGELEDVALENAHRARTNIQNGRIAQTKFGRSTDVTGLMGALTASSGAERPTVPGRYEPYHMPTKNRTVPLASLLDLDPLAATDRRLIAQNLHQLFPTEDGRAYYSYHNVLEPGDKPDLEKKLLSLMASDPELRAAMRCLISAPLRARGRMKK